MPLLHRWVGTAKILTNAIKYQIHVMLMLIVITLMVAMNVFANPALLETGATAISLEPDVDAEVMKTVTNGENALRVKTDRDSVGAEAGTLAMESLTVVLQKQLL